MIVTHRIVATWEPDRWPEGVLTGYDDKAGGFALEHVISFTPRRLRSLLRWGMAQAWALDFQYITFFVPKDFPLAPQLTRVGRGLGFQEYGHDPTREYFVCHRPAPEGTRPAVGHRAAREGAGGRA